MVQGYGNKIPTKKQIFLYSLILALALPLPYLVCFDVCSWGATPALVLLPGFPLAFSIIVLVPIYTAILFFLTQALTQRLKYSHYVVLLIVVIISLGTRLFFDTPFYLLLTSIFDIGVTLIKHNLFQLSFIFDIILQLSYISLIGAFAITISHISTPSFKREGLAVLFSVLILTSFIFYLSNLNAQTEDKFLKTILNARTFEDCDSLKSITTLGYSKLSKLMNNPDVAIVSSYLGAYDSCIATVALRSRDPDICKKLGSARGIECRNAYFIALKTEDQSKTEYKKNLIVTAELNSNNEYPECSIQDVVVEVQNVGNRRVYVSSIVFPSYDQAGKKIDILIDIGFPQVLNPNESRIICDALLPQDQWNEEDMIIYFDILD